MQRSQEMLLLPSDDGVFKYLKIRQTEWKGYDQQVGRNSILDVINSDVTRFLFSLASYLRSDENEQII